MFNKCLAFGVQEFKKFSNDILARAGRCKECGNFKEALSNEIEKVLESEGVQSAIVFLNDGYTYELLEVIEFFRVAEIVKKIKGDGYFTGAGKFILLTEKEARELILNLKEKFKECGDKNFIEFAEKEIEGIINKEGVGGIIVKNMSDGETYPFYTGWEFAVCIR